MDKIAQEDNSLHIKRDLTRPSPVKRPRTHCVVTNQHSGEDIFNFPELLTFQNATKSILQKNLTVVRTTDNSDAQDETFFLQLQDIKLIVTPKVTNSVTDGADTLLPKVCVIAAERHLVHLGKDLVTKSDKLLSYLPDEAGKALGEAHSTTDMSGHSDPFCKRLGKSLEDKALVFIESDKDWRQVQHSVTQMQAFTLTCDKEIISQSDCSPLNVVHDTDTTCSHSAGHEVSNQKWSKNVFSENIVFSKEEQVDHSSRSLSQYEVCEFINSYTKKDHMGNFVREYKNEEKLLQSQICDSDNFTVCDEETKGQVNETSVRKNSFLPVADISVFPHNQVLGRNTATENVRLESDDLYGVKGEYAACKMKAWNEMADHTTEAPESERISQWPPEEDNSVGLYGVIDPAIWNEIDREAEECTAGVELSPSVKVCEMEMPPPLCFDVRTSQEVLAPNQNRQLRHQSTSLQCNDEKEDLWQSHTEPKAASITSSETYNMTGNQSSSPYSPTKLSPARDERQESHRSVELQLSEKDQFESFPNSLDNMRTRDAKQSPTVISKIDTASVEEIKTDPQMNLEKVAESEEEHHLHQEELQKEDTAYELKCVKGKLEGEFDLVADHPYSAHVSNMVEITVEKTKKEVKSVENAIQTAEYENSDVEVKLEELQQQKNTCDPVAFASLPKSDAVVPCQSESSPSLKANSPTTLNRGGRLSPVATACICYNWVPGGFDIFEKILLSPDDYGDNDAGLGQPSHSMQEPESNGFHRAPEEEEREEEALQEDCHTEDMANGFLNSDTSFDVPNFISAADIIALGWPEQQPKCGSTSDSCEPIQNDSNSQSKGSTESESPASEANQYPGFEMKKQFNFVLKELSLFFDISKSDFGRDRESWPKQCHGISEPLRRDSSDSKESLSSPDTGCHKSTSTDNADEDRMEMCGGDPVISCKTGDHEQEVPAGSHMCPKTCQDIADNRELWEVEPGRKIWSPSFMSQQLSHSPLERPKRLEPLRTCSRPIRVGLSKRAKTKHLHRPHPYK